MEEDSATLAAQEREKQGPWEVEICYSEADLYKHHANCQKNPGHLKFTPVDKFSIDHLPAACRDDNLFEYVKVMCDLTVRIWVTHFSDKRPEIIFGTTFPNNRDSRKNFRRVGTGWVSKVKTFPDVHEPTTICTCKDCTHSSTPTRKFAHIFINTAAHVIFNTDEGEHTTCHLFFDNGISPYSCSGVVELKTMSHVEADAKNDRCRMTYITHDISLAERLNATLMKQSQLQESLRRKYRDKHALTIISSHPHGCSKQVSVGHYVSHYAVNDYWTQYRYTTPTCPGSSGARVYVMGRDWMTEHAHSGACRGETGLNYSARGVDSKLTSPSSFWNMLAAKNNKKVNP